MFCGTRLRKSIFPSLPQKFTWYCTPLEMNILNNNSSENLVYGQLPQKLSSVLGSWGGAVDCLKWNGPKKNQGMGSGWGRISW